MSLSLWHKSGLLRRELALYLRFAESFGRVIVVSYGGREDVRLAADFPGLRFICNRWNLKQRLYLITLPWLVALNCLAYTNRIVKTNQMPGSQLAIALARKIGAHFVSRCGYHFADFLQRQYGSNSPKAKNAVALEQVTYANADMALVTSKSFRKRVISDYGFDPDKVFVVPNYVDLHLFNKRPQTSESLRRLVFVGRLDYQKNIYALLEALSCSDIILDVVGDGPLRGQLELASAKFQTRAIFHGRLPHESLPHIFEAADAFVLSSHYEGHPKSLLEAMAAGLPVIGTDVPGISECIDDGTTGLLCPPTVEGLRAAITKLAQDRDLRTRLGEAARSHAINHYSLDTIVEQELSLLSGLVQP